jgi:3'-phosphoadenosine 5'-phosphosulfate sulfotransferase
MSRKKTVKQTTKDTDPAPAPNPNAEPDSPILRYLRSIDDKLDRISDQLAKSEQLAKARPSSKQKRRPVLWARTPEEAEKLKQENPDADAMWFLVAGTKEEAAKLEQENPDADMIIITNVPRAAHD